MPTNSLASPQGPIVQSSETADDFQRQVMGQEYELSEDDVANLQEQLLNSLYQEISSERDDWVRARAQSGVEVEWRKAEALYDGEDVTEDGSAGLEDTLRNGSASRFRSGGTRSRVRINIVAPAVDNQVARMCEILLPVDDKNWGIRPTPNPAVSSA